MDTVARGRLRALQPGFSDVLGIFVLVAVAVLGVHRLFGDSDPATHVATGNWILRHHRVPGVDPFSATHAGGRWFAHEWLADVAFALVHRAAGWTGLLAASAIVIATTHVLLYRFLVRRGDDALVGFVAVLAAATVASAHWLARPHLLTVLFLVLWTIVLEDVVSGRRAARRLAILPFSMVVWVNVHGGFLVGLVVLGCYLVGSLPMRRSGPSQELDRLAGPLAVTLAACGAAVLLNPWGWRLPAHLVSFFGVPRSAMASIDEFARASVRDRAGLTLAAFLVVCAAALGAGLGSGGRRRGAARVPFHPSTLLAFGVTAVMALVSIRHAELVAVFGAVVIAGGASAWIARKAGGREEWEGLRRREARRGGATFAAAAAILALLALTGRPPGAGYDPHRFPVEAVRALRQAGVVPEGAVFSPDLWGGFLILEWPGAKVFVDGRSDMYGDAFMARYESVYRADPGWPDELARADVVWALLPPGAPLAQAMRENPSWSPWRNDGTTSVFRRRAAE